jgi:hypothetical protein
MAGVAAAPSADPGQLLPHQHVDDPLAPHDRADGDHARVIRDDLPDPRGALAATTASAEVAGTIATSLPSFATWNGSRPSISQAARTGPGIGIAASSRTIPTPDVAAISLSADERPPRVGSRRTRTSGSTASTAPTRPLSACVSEAISTSNSRPSRTLMIATPWSPIGPDRITTSPGLARSADGPTPSGTRPIPAVFTKRRSAAPRPTTFVSPVTIRAPARVAARAADAVIAASSSRGSPSSMT